MSSFVHDHNRQAWDARVRRRETFTKPASDEDFKNPLAVIDGLGWLGDSIRGKLVLCLAAGGGSQSALYAAAGANVTVVDISGEMLALDRQVATERGLNVEVVQASMDDLSMLDEAAFDIVIHPVSSCYVPDLPRVYRQVARVMAAGGIYVSQHKQPASLQASTEASTSGYPLTEPYYRTDPLPQVAGSRHREQGTLEFLHRWEELIGALCRSGFVIEDLVEPLHADKQAPPGSFAHRSCYVAPYVRIKARRTGQSAAPASSVKLWTP